MYSSIHATAERWAAGSRTVPVMLMVATALVIAGALAGGPAPAAASSLDYQGLAYQSTDNCVCPAYMMTAPYLTTSLYRVSTPALIRTHYVAASSDRPIRRRRPYRDRDRDRYRDRYEERDNYEPHYFAALGAGNFDPDDQPGNGLWANGELGSEVGDALDLGVRINWYHRESDRSQIISEFTDPAGNVGQRVIVTNDIETNLIPLMAFMRVRFPLSRDFQPYVGGGIGWEWLTVEGTDDAGFTFQDDYDGFGAQLFGGLNVGVSPNMGLYGEALWNKATVKNEFFDLASDGRVQDEIDLDGLAFHGGLRFRF